MWGGGGEGVVEEGGRGYWGPRDPLLSCLEPFQAVDITIYCFDAYREPFIRHPSYINKGPIMYSNKSKMLVLFKIPFLPSALHKQYCMTSRCKCQPERLTFLTVGFLKKKYSNYSIVRCKLILNMT